MMVTFSHYSLCLFYLYRCLAIASSLDDADTTTSPELCSTYPVIARFSRSNTNLKLYGNSMCALNEIEVANTSIVIIITQINYLQFKEYILQTIRTIQHCQC